MLSLLLLGQGTRVNPEIIRYNERYKALATLCDNAALATFIASAAQFFDVNGSNFLIVFGVALGVAFLTGGWHIRALIQSES
jgi:hypothetical protein